MSSSAYARQSIRKTETEELNGVGMEEPLTPKTAKAKNSSTGLQTKCSRSCLIIATAFSTALAVLALQHTRFSNNAFVAVKSPFKTGLDEPEPESFKEPPALGASFYDHAENTKTDAQAEIVTHITSEREGSRADLLQPTTEFEVGEAADEEIDMNLPYQSHEIVWDEVYKSPEGKVESITSEWGIRKDEEFTSLAEIHEKIGNNCPYRRHCSIKQMHKVFLDGGRWSQSQALAEKGNDMVFEPHNCWLFNFKGDENWASLSHATSLAVFISENTTKSYFERVSQANELFHFMESSIPEGFQAEAEFRSKLGEFLEERRKPGQKEVILFVNWVTSRSSYFLVRLLQRITAEVKDRFVKVVWVSSPYADLEQSKAAIASNKEMEAALSKVWEPNSIYSNPLLTKRIPKTLYSSGPTSQTKFTVSMKEIAKNPRNYVLFDVRTNAETLRAADHLQYFSNHSTKLSLNMISAGWTPSLHLDANIVVFCSNGMSANKAMRLLRLHGFKNARSMALSRVLPEDMLQVGATLSFRNDTKLLAIDLFAPTIAFPAKSGLENDSVSPEPALVQYLSNYAMNIMYRHEIIRLANRTGEEHVCQESGQCTSCFRLIGSIPSQRVSFSLIKNYLKERETATKITLSREHKIWIGDWLKFLQDNGNSRVQVRTNYETAKTRQFKTVPLAYYLEKANIVAPLGDGKYKIIDGEPISDVNASSHPIYAGNNKLRKDRMNNFNFKYPEWIRAKSLEVPAMWLGNRGSMSSLHVDHVNRGNLAFQVLGSKRWHLFPPGHQMFLYGKHYGVVNWSQVIDPLTYPAKASQFPLFKFALINSAEVDVLEGEMLYNPNKWWHAVYNLEASLMLNFWIKADGQLLPPPP